MSKATRLELIKKIEEIRDSKVITYVVSDRPGVNASIEEGDLRELYEHIKRVPLGKKIDLFLYSLGGASVVGWALTNLIREHTDKFEALVPFRCFSCATSICLGADKIVMHKAGILGPVDPLVMNDFNPKVDNTQRYISVEDVSGYLALIKDKFGISNEDNIVQGFNALSKEVNPLALGNVHRHYLKSRDDTKKLLELHFNAEADKEKINKIIEMVVEKFYYHGHHINRKEAKSIGLDIDFAENFKGKSGNFGDLMWALLNDYEEDLELKKPYEDKVPSGHAKNKLPLKFIESSSFSSTRILEQEFIDLGFPKEAKIVLGNNNLVSVYLPQTPRMDLNMPVVIPGEILAFQFVPIKLGDKIYEKRETAYWEN